MNITCNTCGKSKPITEYYKDRSRPSGHANKCKQCMSEYYRANVEYRLAYARDWYLEHEEEIAQHYWENKESINDKMKMDYLKNIDKRKEYNKIYYKTKIKGHEKQ